MAHFGGNSFFAVTDNKPLMFGFAAEESSPTPTVERLVVAPIFSCRTTLSTASCPKPGHVYAMSRLPLTSKNSKRNSTTTTTETQTFLMGNKLKSCQFVEINPRRRIDS